MLPPSRRRTGREPIFFGGKVIVLIGPRTFSSASDLADAIKTYHLATLVGQETGGRVNTFGDETRRSRRRSDSCANPRPIANDGRYFSLREYRISTAFHSGTFPKLR